MSGPGDPALPARPGRLRTGALCAVCLGVPWTLLASACGPAPEPPGTLLEAAVVAPEDGRSCPGPGGEGGPAAPRRITRAHSLRTALVTCPGVDLRVPVRARGGATLDLALGLAAGAEGDSEEDGAASPGNAVLELRRGGEVTTLLETTVPADGWAEHTVEVPPAGFLNRQRGELVLRSVGEPAVAWAELFLDRRDPSRNGAAGQPSLVLVSLDTVRADHLSLYGYGRPTSPELERFARGAHVFTRAYSSSSWTLPSTATLLTGLLPTQHGALTVRTRLGPDVPTVARRLQAAGYRTAAVTDGGFAGFGWGLERGFQRYDVTPGAAWQAGAKDARRIFDGAAAWVRRNRHEPFFLFVHTYEAHQPYLNREGFADPFLEPDERGRSWRVQAKPHEDPPDEDGLRRMVALYDGEIARADRYLGELLDVLARELGDRVAVVVTSDHGEEFLEHGDLEHGFGKVFDPNVRVPLVVKAPGAESGRRLDVPVTGLDVAPTLLGLAGLPHDDLPGRSLLEPAAGAGDSAAGAGGGREPRADGPRSAAGRATGGGRPVLVHGLPSFPDLAGGERFRLHDRRSGSLIFDRMDPPEGALLAYEPGSGTAERLTGSSEAPEGARALAPRLGAVLAWLRADGFFVRLPDAARRLALPEGARLRPQGVWTGEGWRDWPDGPEALDLAPRPPHFLAFGLGEGQGGWEVLIARSEAAPAPYRLTAERRPPWDPFADALPAPGVVLPGAVSHRAGLRRIDDATARELRALGYLQ